MSNYRVKNEWNHFDFEEAVIGEIRYANGCLNIYLDNVKILPENSTNRDIRTMRANEVLFYIEQAHVESLIEEGYRVYDADGKLVSNVEDRLVTPEDFAKECEALCGCTIYSIERTENLYTISIDTEDHTYELKVTGTADVTEWDRYLSLN